MGRPTPQLDRLEQLRAQIAEFRGSVEEFRRDIQESIEIASLVRKRIIAERFEQTLRRSPRPRRVVRSAFSHAIHPFLTATLPPRA